MLKILRGTGITVRPRHPKRPKRRLWRLGFAGFLLTAVLVLAGASHPRVRNVLRYAEEPACYLVPVSGIGARDLTSTFGAPRSGGRKHKGVDIFADRGTAVLSATDGVVWRVGRSKLGGNVVWVFGEGMSFYYYAHLDDWAPGIKKGVHVKAGEPLGSIGNSGNARSTPTHLHFSVTRFTVFGGRKSIDPVPMLSNARTMPAYSLANGVTKPGAGNRPGDRYNDWSGNPCHLPSFPRKSAGRRVQRFYNGQLTHEPGAPTRPNIAYQNGLIELVP